MAKKGNLFSLIQSLTRNEKRYFKVFCAQASQSQNYLQLFDAIDKQQSYDEKAIKKKFAGTTFVRQLHVTKNYLRQMILKSLRNFHAGNSKSAELADHLRNVEVLFNKELFDQCHQELKKAASIAQEYELLPGQVQVADWNRKLIQAQSPHDRAAILASVVARDESVSQMQNLTEYWKLAIGVSGALQGLPIDNLEHIDWLQDASSAHTLQAKVLHYNARYLSKIQARQNEAAIEALYELIRTLEAHPNRMKEHPNQYAGTVNNCLSYLVFQKEYDAALALTQRAKAFYAQWKVGKENKGLLKQVLRTYNIELEVYRDMRKFESDPEYLDQVEAFVRSYTYKMPKSYLISFWFQLANIHFLRKDFSRSLHWLNQILNARFKGIRTDLQVAARMLNLMVHAEQHNLFVLRYFVDNTKRFLKKMRDVQPFEQVLLRFFTQLGRIPIANYKDAYQQLQTQLFPKDADPLVPMELDYIDYKGWLTEKV